MNGSRGRLPGDRLGSMLDAIQRVIDNALNILPKIFELLNFIIDIR